MINSFVQAILKACYIDSRGDYILFCQLVKEKTNITKEELENEQDYTTVLSDFRFTSGMRS